MFVRKITNVKRGGAALIISLIFIMVFSAIAVSMASLSGSNVQIARGHQHINDSLFSAQSGVEVVRYWLNGLSVDGTLPASQRLSTIATNLQTRLTDAGVTNINVTFDGSQIIVSEVALDSQNGQSFSAIVRQLDDDTLQTDVTGLSGQIDRTVRSDFDFQTRGNNVFNYGVATKGPLSLAGNIQLDGINVSVEASVYIESENVDQALTIIGNSQIAGEVSITNEDAFVVLQGGQAGIGGETGQDAIDNHVDIGVPPAEFPTPVATQFEHYATNTVDENTDTSSDMTLENVKILAGTNPQFSGQVTINGIIYIEQPNVVTFTGGTIITGMIVAEGDTYDNSGTNQINFLGNVESNPVEDLPQTEEFAGIREETGTFILAPGFSTSFGGSFETLNGVIASNGVSFFGNAGGIIGGSVINYSDTPMTMSGNSDLYFNRSGIDENPAGFSPEKVLQHTAGSYNEIIL